jgi:hypothetical protein
MNKIKLLFGEYDVGRLRISRKMDIDENIVLISSIILLESI